MSHRRTARNRLLTGLIAGPLALSLVACGGDDDNDNDAVATAPAAPASSAPAATTTTPAPAEAPIESAPAGTTADDDSALLAAAATALGAVDGSRILSIDRSDDSSFWDVSVVSADGTENEVDVSADGASITRGPVVDGDDNDDDNDDLAERQRLFSAQVDHEAALSAARGAVPTGAVDSLDLDEDDNTTRWDVQFGEDDGQSVDVDAASGQVLSTDQDD